MVKMSNQGKKINAPVASHERIELIDVLRGFAVFGILVANMASYSGQPSGVDVWYQAPDKLINILTRFFVEAKFYSLFSFLFGWGMAVQLTRARAKGTSFLPTYMRRLLVLLLFGIIHGTLIWVGDILTLYALLGFLLLLFRNRSPRYLITATIAFLLFSIVLTLPIEAVDNFRAWYIELTGFMRTLNYADGMYLTGSFLEVTRTRIQDYLRHNSYGFFSFGNVFSMFLLGLATGKAGFFQNIDRNLPRIRKGIWVALAIGLTLNAVFVAATFWPNRFPNEYWQTIRVGARTIGAPAMMLFYILTFTLLYQIQNWRKRLNRIAPIGKAALSNYLFQSVLLTLVFYGYGFGFYGRLDPTLGLILTILIYLLQLNLSTWWLDRYRFGPAEWVWRTLTYGYVQPLKRRWSFEKEKPVRVTRFTGNAPSVLLMASGALILLLWVGGLILWDRSIQHEQVQESAFFAALPRREGIAAEEEQDPGTSQELEIQATPVVDPVPYLPGDVAVTGDLVALASTADVNRALQQIQTLTGSPYRGRLAGSVEGWAAGDYIAVQFSAAGLQAAGEDNGFFQAFPVPHEPLSSLPQLEVYKDGELLMDFVLHQDFNVRSRDYAGEGTFTGDVLWANNCEKNDFIDVVAEDKIVFCRQMPDVDAGRNAIEHGAQGLLLLIDPTVRPLDFAYSRKESIVPHPIPTFLVSPSVAETLLTGSNVSLQDLSLAFRSRPLATSAHLEVEQAGSEGCVSRGCVGRNVLGVIQGRDPAVANEVIILGAHYDHMGQAPDGTIWPGANDDASGVAVLLEIARSWHDQGYVPRRTVMFAAWDGEELGLLGSWAYVKDPSYPLDETVAVIQLDMIGSGSGDALLVDGHGGNEAQIIAAAEEVGLEATVTDIGRSDHFPFLQIGVPANMIGWLDGENPYRDYHRPVDTVERIDLDKLSQSLKVTSVALLSLAEGDPEIRELLDQRALALLNNDLSAFLATSHPEQRNQAQQWFEDAIRLNPLEFSLHPARILINGDQAAADVKIRMLYAPEGDSTENNILLGDSAVRFVRTEEGWRWAGSDLIPVVGDLENDALSTDIAGVSVRVSIPGGEEVEIGDVLQQTVPYMQDAGRKLGLSLPQDLHIELYRSSSDLALSTLPSLGRSQSVWITNGVIKLVLGDVIEDPALLEDALIRLLLVEAGVVDETLPWLWTGLPILIRAEADPADIHPDYLPQFYRSLFHEAYLQDSTASWASVGYLVEQRGWFGMGRWIRSIGRACAAEHCVTEEGRQAALQQTLGMDPLEFEETWKAYWTEELGEIAEGVDALLAVRAQAIENGDEGLFLSTVDSTISKLISEQGGYFAHVVEAEAATISFEWVPVAILDDGSLLADVTVIQETMDDSAPRRSRTTSRIRFSPTVFGYLWAGKRFESINRGRVRVFYSPGDEDLAGEILTFTERINSEVRTALSLRTTPQVTIKLYDVDSEFWRSIWPDRKINEDRHDHTAPDQSLKLRAAAVRDEDSFSTLLTESILRHVLTQFGVESEWLLRGMSLAMLSDMDGNGRSRLAMRQLLRLPSKLERDQLGTLGGMPGPEVAGEETQRLADAQAWDSVSYLLELYGDDQLGKFIQLLGSGSDEITAFGEAFGLDQEEFEEAWEQSVLRGHLQTGREQIAEGFDPDNAYTHVQILSSEEFTGRGVGSTGGQGSAEYIAALFEAYGLIPLIPGEQQPGVGESGEELTETLQEQEALGYLQQVPIYSIQLERQPSFQVLDQDGVVLADYNYREYFQTIPQGYPYSGPVIGDLVWSPEEDFSGLDLSGKIILRDIEGSLADEVDKAVASGAAGLLVVTDIRGGKPFLSKDALPLSEPVVVSLPVLHLGRNAFEDLLRLSGETLVSVKRSPPALPLGVRVLIDLPLSPTKKMTAVNVLGLLPGSDPSRADEVVILGAHYDHVGDDPDAWDCVPGVAPSEEAKEEELCALSPGLRYPGENDNASGIGVLLEVARAWQEMGYHPAHSVLFAAWGAQESGEVGSRYYIDHPLFPLEKTLAMIQLDDVGGGTGYYLEGMGAVEQDGLLLSRVAIQDELTGVRMSLVMDSADEIQRLSRLAPEWIEWPSREREYQSDQIPFFEQGVPSLLLRWRKASEDNLPEELMDEILIERLDAAGRTVMVLIMSLAH